MRNKAVIVNIHPDVIEAIKDVQSALHAQKPGGKKPTRSEALSWLIANSIKQREQLQKQGAECAMQRVVFDKIVNVPRLNALYGTSETTKKWVLEQWEKTYLK